VSVTRFEDLIAWQRAKELARDVYALARAPELARDTGLRSQIQRASVSVMSNIAEGFENRSRAQFRRYLSISRSSCAEVRSLLHLLREINYVTPQQFEDTLAKANEVARIVSGLQRSIAENEPRVQTRPLRPSSSVSSSALGSRNSELPLP
jgi:four helix bundle protein